MQFIGYFVAETHRAFMFQDHFWHQPEWLPKSQTTIIQGDGSAEVVLTVATWLCKKNDFKEFTERKPDGEE